MMDQITERPDTEVAEIDRHKYYLSEKAGYDVGWEFAEQDWEANFAATFRAEHSAEHSTEECTIEEQPVENLSEQDSKLRIDAAESQTGFTKVLKRIFNRKRSV